VRCTAACGRLGRARSETRCGGRRASRGESRDRVLPCTYWNASARQFLTRPITRPAAATRRRSRRRKDRASRRCRQGPKAPRGPRAGAARSDAPARGRAQPETHLRDRRRTTAGRRNVIAGAACLETRPATRSTPAQSRHESPTAISTDDRRGVSDPWVAPATNVGVREGGRSHPISFTSLTSTSTIGVGGEILASGQGTAVERLTEASRARLQ
jgi:hypothetical protein